MAEIRKQSRDCTFGDLTEDLMLHVLIRGIDSERMRRRLFETDDLKLEKALRMCRNMEAIAADLQMWSSRKEEVAAIAAGSSQKYQRLPSEEKHKTAKRNCGSCGYDMPQTSVQHKVKPVISARTLRKSASPKKKHRWLTTRWTRTTKTFWQLMWIRWERNCCPI